MSTDPAPATPTCPTCGSPLAASASGLCPRCLMAEAMRPTGGGSASAFTTPLTPEELAPHFPQLHIVRCLGRGGMGVVYEARQKSLNRAVALKLLAPERAADPDFAARFEREAQALAALNHPHIVAVYDFGQAGGFYYLLMEYIDGPNLRQLLQTRRLFPREALAIIPPVCDALQSAHDHGIVHRDIKPENLLLDKSGRVKIADFGVAKMIGLHPDPTDPTPASPQSSIRSTLAGTPDYAAPEQSAESGEVDHRADLYSLGVVLYELLTGSRPTRPVEAPSRRIQVDVRIDEIVLRALQETPELRFSTATEFRTRVEGIMSEPRPAAESSPLLKVGSGTLAPIADLRTWHGQFFHLQTRGQLVLDDRRLVHSSPRGTTTIPLGDIEEASIGRYPRSMNPMGLSAIVLRYRAGAESRQVVIGPIERIFGLPQNWEARVDEWHAAIVTAVRTATGRDPIVRPPGPINLPGGASWIVAGFMLLPVVLSFLFVTLLIRAPGSGPALAVLPSAIVFGCIIVGFVLTMFLGGRRTHGRPKAGAFPALIVTVMLIVTGFAYFLFLKVRPAPAPALVAAPVLVQQGWQQLQSGHPGDSLAAFRAALAKDPNDPASLNGLGWALFNLGKTTPALEQFQKVLTLVPDHAGALNGVGQIYFARRHYAEAEPPFLQAAAQGASAAWYGLAKLYLLTGRFPEAEKYAQMLVDSGQADAGAVKMLEAAKARRLSEGLRLTLEPPPQP